MNHINYDETQTIHFSEIMSQYSKLLQTYPGTNTSKSLDIDKLLQKKMQESVFKIVVLDDDPTGVQSVHDISVFTDWSEESLTKGFEGDSRLFFILTNSRGVLEEEATKIQIEIADRIVRVSEKMGIPFVMIHRGDSTLRGHFPLETAVFKEELFKKEKRQMDGELLIPFFEAGGRYTINDIHYVKYGNDLVPAGETEFAKDKTFGYHHSNLRNYIEEKTKGKFKADQVISISVEELKNRDFPAIENKLMEARDFQKIIVNALDQNDLKVLSIVLYNVLKKGKKFLFRTAADFVKIFANVSDQDLLSGKQMRKTDSENGGLIVVGSHTTKTTQQLEQIKDREGIKFFELNTDLVLEGDLSQEVSRVVKACEETILCGQTAVVYTKRKLLTFEGESGEKALQRSLLISDAVQNLVASIQIEPSFIIAKGGITSSDIGVKALRVREAVVLGQAQPGIPVWKTGKESKFPGMPYIIFPGNVGDKNTLFKIVDEILGEESKNG